MFWTYLLVFILFLYIICDLNYFLRCLFYFSISKFFSKQKHKLSDISTLYGICTTQDIDVFLSHMNNARYLRDMDFARFKFYWLSGLFDVVRNAKANVVQAATSIRYRRSIPIFSFYKIETKLIWWNEKSIFFEHKFKTLSDGFVRTIAYSKQGVSNVNVIELLKVFPECIDRPMELPDEIKHWIKSMEVSSYNLRKG